MGKKFHVSAILSIITPRFVAIDPDSIKNGVEGMEVDFDKVYEILNYMTGDDLYTHQLGRAADECRRYLKDQFPQMAAETGDELSAGMHWQHWVWARIQKYGAWHEVEPIPMDDHDVIDPLEELKRMKPDAEIIQIDLSEEDTPSDIGDINWKAD